MYLDNKIIKEDMESIYNRDIDWTVLDGKTIFVSGAYGMITSYWNDYATRNLLHYVFVQSPDFQFIFFASVSHSA